MAGHKAVGEYKPEVIRVVTDIAYFWTQPFKGVIRFQTHDTVFNFDTGRLEIKPGSKSEWQSIRQEGDMPVIPEKKAPWWKRWGGA